ncbi:MAG: PT domain-containing protein [Candidatus Omnitrophica bacterium]|nr:PT domain-containing protein [Candidatus Omnitrophota bacterium]
MGRIKIIEREGFGLVEVMVSVLLLTLITGGTLLVLGVPEKVISEMGRRRQAINFCQDTLEDLISKHSSDPSFFNSAELAPGTHRSELPPSTLKDRFSGTREYTVEDLEGGVYKKITVKTSWIAGGKTGSKTLVTLLANPQPVPLRTPTPSPTPSPSPSVSPSAFPSGSPSASPSESPSASPSTSPSTSPSASPSVSPSVSPTASPSVSPTASPSASPTVSPSASPTVSPSASPTPTPTSKTQHRECVRYGSFGWCVTVDGPGEDTCESNNDCWRYVCEFGRCVARFGTGPDECSQDSDCLCVPSCAGKECGSDGCGGSCGECDGYNCYSCRNGRCVYQCSHGYTCVMGSCIPSGGPMPE